MAEQPRLEKESRRQRINFITQSMQWCNITVASMNSNGTAPHPRDRFRGRIGLSNTRPPKTLRAVQLENSRFFRLTPTGPTGSFNLYFPGWKGIAPPLTLFYLTVSKQAISGPVPKCFESTNSGLYLLALPTRRYSCCLVRASMITWHVSSGRLLSALH